MRRFTDNLNDVRIATPCPAEWEAMIGTDRVRFCGQCQLNVYDLSSMSRREAESLIARTEGRLCVRFYRRKDGSIITQDCPVGLRALKRRAQQIKRAVASSLLGFLAGIGANGSIKRIGNFLLGLDLPGTYYGHTMGVVAQQKQPVVYPAKNGRLIMGRMKIEPSRRPRKP